MNIVFLAQRLAVGGAERQLVSLATGLAARGHATTIITFYPGGELSAGLADTGVRHVDIGKAGRYDAIRPAFRLRRLIARARPDVVNSWLTVPNIVAATLKFSGGGWPLIWSVRHAFDDVSAFDWLARFTDAIEPKFARFADLVIVNSEAARIRAEAAGFSAGRLSVLANGIDVDRFRPDRARGQMLRHAWGIPAGATVVGYAARIDPLKGHDVFLAAASRLAAADPTLCFVCPGAGDDALLARLRAAAQAAGLGGRIFWPGLQLDMPAVYNALDLAVMCSAAESWPNVIGESLSCGVPMVVTDVGDAARIVPPGVPVVAPNDPAALATAIRQVLCRAGEPPFDALRRHIVENFSRQTMIERTESLMTDVAARRVR